MELYEFTTCLIWRRQVSKQHSLIFKSNDAVPLSEVCMCVCVCVWTHNEPGLIISQEDIACFVSPFLLMQNASYIMQHAHKCTRLFTQKNKKYPQATQT